VAPARSEWREEKDEGDDGGVRSRSGGCRGGHDEREMTAAWEGRWSSRRMLMRTRVRGG
jgi:hypothetical protein